MPEADDLALITEAAQGAGEIARHYFGGTTSGGTRPKANPSPKPISPLTVSCAKRLTAARPDYGWLSEESVDNEERKAARRTFIVDPIDGTIAFLKSKPHFTHALAIVEDGRPIAPSCSIPSPRNASARKPAAARRWTVSRRMQASVIWSKAAACWRPKHCSNIPPGRSAPNVPWPPMHVEQRNSIAYRLALVGAGIFDAAISLSSKHDWDLAAGDLIVQEAGGRVTDHRGQILRYNGAVPIQRSVVAAGPSLHPLLIERTRRLNLPER